MTQTFHDVQHAVRGVRIYSIDEAFLGVRGTLPELQALARAMKQEAMDHLGLPVCVGIAKTTGTAEYS
ncbi:hypothetical protein [Arthrobacter sp. AQ5-05]|uniref:Y-family DNA polymerase n=1 Tax=Arthrobacter sp. AQ5-05 TaxID=2184581 RepID=UPI00256FCF27|nr:hypothetical protein [Arthrobacter sp. AQ5-05]